MSDLFVEKAQAHNIEPAPASPNDLHILIVDDEPDYIHQMKETLEGLKRLNTNYVVHEACSKKEALEKLYACPSMALVILDIKMETDSAGLDFVKEVRNQPKFDCLRIIPHTAEAGLAPQDMVIFDYDVDGYISKHETSPQQKLAWFVASLRSYEKHHLEKFHRTAWENLANLEQLVTEEMEQTGLLYSSALEHLCSVLCQSPQQKSACHGFIAKIPGHQEVQFSPYAYQVSSVHEMRNRLKFLGKMFGWKWSQHGRGALFGWGAEEAPLDADPENMLQVISAVGQFETPTFSVDQELYERISAVGSEIGFYDKRWYHAIVSTDKVRNPATYSITDQELIIFYREESLTSRQYYLYYLTGFPKLQDFHLHIIKTFVREVHRIYSRTSL